ncbi:hypothetical protein BGP_2540 [Beggiatoa sp. PS]|nr:hypothetical protein BGP_2540 [Beggiatoa sp. PS]
MIGKSEIEKHFVEFREYRREIIVPPVFTIETTLADSMLKALKNTRQDFLIEQLQIDELYALTIGRNPTQWKEILRHLSSKVLNNKTTTAKVKIYSGIMLHLIIGGLRKITRKFLLNMTTQKKTETVYNASDIFEASNLLVRHLNESGMTEKVIENFEKLCLIKSKE